MNNRTNNTQKLKYELPFEIVNEFMKAIDSLDSNTLSLFLFGNTESENGNEMKTEEKQEKSKVENKVTKLSNAALIRLFRPLSCHKTCVLCRNDFKHSQNPIKILLTRKINDKNISKIIGILRFFAKRLNSMHSTIDNTLFLNSFLSLFCISIHSFIILCVFCD